MTKTWFITGSSRGFGRALVEQLLASTEDLVIATARDPKALSNLVASYQDRILTIPLDVNDPSAVKNAVDTAVKHCKQIDVLVNNAGYAIVGALEECSMEEIRKVFETNLFGLIEVTKAVMPHMRERKSGHIINISSVAGLVSTPALGIYNGTKFAVEGLSEALAIELKDFGIKVTLIEPGPFKTDFANSIKITEALEVYKGTAAGKVREFLINLAKMDDQSPPGDPIKAVKIIIDIAHMDNPPLRIPLGNSAMDRINLKFTAQGKAFAALEQLARSADFDS